MKEKNNKKLDEGSPYDPLNVAKQEGKIFGVGLSGKYRKNFITRLGFLILGMLLFAQGLFLVTVTFFKDYAHGSVIIYIWYAILSLAVLLLGIMLIKNSLTR